MAFVLFSSHHVQIVEKSPDGMDGFTRGIKFLVYLIHYTTFDWAHALRVTLCQKKLKT